MIWSVLAWFFVMPLVFMFSAMLLDAYLKLKGPQLFFVRLAWPFGVVIFFDDFLQHLPKLLSISIQQQGVVWLLVNLGQLLWMAAAFALILMLLSALVELPLRWYAGNMHLALDSLLHAARPIVVIAIIGFLARWILPFFSWSNFAG